MNLGQYIAQQLLEAEDKETIALFPGAFKPPHKGHFEVVQQLLDKADQVVVLVSPKTRDGVDADESVAIWELYKTLLNSSVEVKLTEESPIREVYNVVKNNPDTNFILAAGKGEVDRARGMFGTYRNIKGPLRMKKRRPMDEMGMKEDGMMNESIKGYKTEFERFLKGPKQ